MSNSGTPAGYRESALGETLLVARDDQHDAVRGVLSLGTVHDWAARQPGARPLQGRQVAWATRLPGGTDIVVRHSRHGGALAALTGDLFLSPSRAPYELQMSLQLHRAGVPTPAVIAYAVYPAIGPLCRADVVTAFVDGADFPAAWAVAASPAARDAIIDAVAALLRAMQRARALHRDLNVKNILISDADGAVRAWILDVDRVYVKSDRTDAPARRNAWRLRASLAKWRAERGLDFGTSHLRRLMTGADMGPLGVAGWSEP